MLKNSPKRVGETIAVKIEFDPNERVIAHHPKLIKALSLNKDAKAIFDNLRPSLQLEIVRYIARLKSEESVDRNIARAIDFLLGKGRFIGRDKP
ncbi:YdeI/OmpD-associated family protein [Mucilaginibacter corticis]|uniref:YdeI/OmpD-associated family protein n=1 Tax=Mucilaginibacter corticis TaxID=2597670 RepID=UPI001FE2EE33|nr:YdeI/OmpD-associated family protein [Mucilaginibacter corticis]